MKPIVFVAGARPNFMKVAPIMRACAARDDVPECRLVHTGQHYDAGMSDVFLQQLGLPPPHAHLEVGSGAHGAQTARVLAEFEKYLLESSPRPCGVVVVGDVNSTIAATLAAVKLGIPVAHVEAGLRSFDRRMPEEINRLATDAIADLLFVSEPSGATNLAKEGIADERVHYVGNVMIDTLVAELDAARELDTPGKLGLAGKDYAVVTCHRPSNVDEADRLTRVVDFLVWLSEQITVVFPVHPRTRARLDALDFWPKLKDRPGLILREPLGYRENLGLMASAKVVVTDSGGVQEETAYLQVPCLTLRENTERPVTVTEGTNTIIGLDLDRARALVREVIDGTYSKTGQAIKGWDGRAGERIAEVLARLWQPSAD